MTTSVLRTADSWWVQTPTGAAEVDTTASTTGGLLEDRIAVVAATGGDRSRWSNWSWSPVTARAESSRR